MQWHELLAGIRDSIAAAMPPNYLVKVGYWAKVPNVAAVHITLGREDFEPRERKLTLHIDLFHRAIAGTDDSSIYPLFELDQQRIEDAALDWLQQQSSVIVATLKSWEQDGGAFVPTYGSRLTLHVTDIYARRVVVAPRPGGELPGNPRTRYLHLAGKREIEVGDPNGNL